MTIKDMHYDFKVKLNKLDSSQYRNMIIPEIDRKLNEAAFIFIKSIAQPRYAKEVGLEMNQRTIDDLRTIIIDSLPLPATLIPNTTDYLVSLPIEPDPNPYLFYVESVVKAYKEDCGEVTCDTIVRKHNDKHKTSPFDESSFEWREVNIHFINNNIRIFTNGNFSVNSLELDYVRKMLYMHNAEDFKGNTYTLPDGTVLIGSQNCELPDNMHIEIVDLAVLITSGEINAQDFQMKQFKTQLNQ